MTTKFTQEEIEQITKLFAVTHIITIVKNWDNPELLDLALQRHAELAPKANSRLANISFEEMYEAVLEQAGESKKEKAGQSADTVVMVPIG